MPLTIVNGPTIAAGQSLSDALDISAGRLVRITCPAEWNNYADISFQASSDGNLFNDIHLNDGREVVIKCGAGWGIFVGDIAWVQYLPHIKIRSGTASHPIIQTAARQFAVALDVP